MKNDLKFMEHIVYKKLPKRFSAKQLKNFFDKSVPGKTLKQCENIIKHSMIVGAFDGDKLVGIGRALDDTVYAFITDIIVHPNYRKQGIGKNIVKILCNCLIENDIRIIHCSTTKNFIPFYKSAIKFKNSPNDTTLYYKKF